MVAGLELLSNSQMADADRLMIADGMAGIELMQAAGRAVAYQAMRMATDGGRILVACGPGNNGGDGFVAARLLRQSGYHIELALLGEKGALKGDAKLAADGWAGEVHALEEADIDRADLIIDSLFGAGLARDIDGAVAEFITQVNGCECAVLSVDMPSGVDGDSGRIRGVAVEASHTVTFFRAKPGHLLMPGRANCGRLKVAYIGIRPSVLDQIKPRLWNNLPSLWRASFPEPSLEGHKYSRGHALIVSGGITGSGAARLAARGALRAGAGLVTMASPKSALLVNAMHLNAIMLRPCENADDLATILADKRMNAVLIGPGTGVGEATRAKTLSILRSGAATLLDADALTSFQDQREQLFAAIAENGLRPVVITPHGGEFSRLFGDIDLNGPTGAAKSKAKGAAVPNISKLERARAAARLSGATIILKGADSVIASPDGRAAINQNAPPTLATAGSGDVLAGILTGFLAQNMPPFEAACAAVWLHGEAANIFGLGLIAEDLTEILPEVLQKLVEHS